MRSTYKGKSYGLNAKYIIDLKTANGNEETIVIYPHDYEMKKFKNFNLTKESLMSKDSMETFLNERIKEGLINCSELTVHELESWRNEVYEFDKKKVIRATYDNWFKYHILGRIYTKISDYRLKQKNKQISKKSVITAEGKNNKSC